MGPELETCDPLDERQFLIAVKRLADNLAYGTDQSSFLGSGVEYVQSRLFQSGDSVKAIDWRVTARTSKLHVKEYEAPKRMPVYLLIDTSASMVVSSQKLSKYAWSLQIAGGIALACLERMSPVGVVGVGERELRIKPALGRDRIYQWLLQLRRYRIDEHTTLADRLSELGSALMERSLVIILSDLYSKNVLPELKLLAQKHDCIVLQLRDPAESGHKGSGIFRAREAESGEEFITHSGARWTDQQVMKDELKTSGVDHLVLPTDEPFVHKLSHFLRARGKAGGGAR